MKAIFWYSSISPFQGSRVAYEKLVQVSLKRDDVGKMKSQKWRKNCDQ
jgi:hypothetical protein